MATPYAKVFDSFLSKIEDTRYSTFSEPDLIADLTKLLNAGIVNFEYPKINIFDKNDVGQIFNVDLSVFEVEIIGLLMKHEWLKREIYSTRTLEQMFSTSDFRLTSQAAHLEALLKLEKETRNEITTRKRKYSYRGQNNRPDFSGLSGDGQ